MVKKYYKGQKVIFTAKENYDLRARNDSGKVAIITYCHGGNFYGIFIDGSKNNSYTSNRSIQTTWYVLEDDLKPIQGQLLFVFINKV